MELLALWNKYKDIFPYAFFGVCTTAVNVVSYWLFADILKFSVMQSTVIAWTLAVLFAYVTNRIFVFSSDNKNIFKEIVSFFSSRIATLLLEMVIMFIFVTKLNLNVFIFTIVTQVLVIVLNYVFSKIFVFKK